MKYDKIRYPDGQLSVKITDSSHPQIIERINSYADLIFIKSIAEAYYSFYSKIDNYTSEFIPLPLTLFIPCLFGQRSDRRFSENQSFDLKIICEIINSCNFKRVDILDPHSDVCLALINNSNKIDSFTYVKQSIDPKAVYGNQIIDESLKKDLVLVSPDAGSYKKTFHYAELMDLPVVASNKYRDLSGKITLNFIGDIKGKNCFIIDDLADGGYTFVLLAKTLKEQGARRVDLYVTHAYFNKGFEELKKYIDHIYCTNSVKDIDMPDYVTQFKII